MNTPQGSTSDATLDAGFVADLRTYIASDVAQGDPSELETLDEATDLLLSGLVDSLGVVLIVEWIEQRLGTEIDPGDVVIEHFQTINDMVAFLSST